MALLKSGTRIYGNATIDTNLAIDGRDTFTSNSTGALTVAGGVGVAGVAQVSSSSAPTAGNGGGNQGSAVGGCGGGGGGGSSRGPR